MKSMRVITRSGSLDVAFSINKIAEAICKACEHVVLIDIAEVGGRSSLAFNERLVKEYNAEHMKECPKCGVALRQIEIDAADCPGCGQQFRFPEANGDKCYVDEEGVAEFVGRKIGNGFAQRTGDVYHLGEVNGRTVYFGTNPDKRFYSAHKGDVSIVLGSNRAEVPEHWDGSAAYLSELFYVHEATGTIRIAHNILNGIIPKASKPHQIGPRKIRDRRDQWLMFFSDLLSRPYDPNDFYRGCIRPKVVRDWFVENYDDKVPQNEKEYQRDMTAFRHLPDKKTMPDQREGFIVLLMRKTADRKLPMKERLALATIIPELVLYLKNAAEKTGRPVEITRGAWQHCRDGKDEYIAVTDCDKFFDELAKKMGEEEDAA